jgi:hypothetical protein
MTEYDPRCEVEDLRMNSKSKGTGTSLILFQSPLLVEGAVVNVDKNLTSTNGSDVQR